ncbi:NADH dehydrogenase [ubiquinone] 1 beta subcomplex subunit 1 [Pteropus alecto]|uniref:NADH dehydrogenase [ubiquinone] 1 beta subcomplex subunit 1 n=2 Tax=Pteropus TaxID=9401 RepID=A0A6P3QWA6_PTEVA|nr:NADH dehydrogenase [ubiquinone] 1 beta subcomplex subunit 1 [Pteropus alecto]XP_011371461.1 NADH dehydrogenase [ubiquinone] 1 beta subcomplex subunit 1 isoform X2 [Pteropus vampyrus]XP_011371462.1 NADH dehydrogenase [ubiquinone] 1 beta subcomplex subunit 1 isoform X3 [Pteropus vampyrus]XP_039739987.1 NADH dehydrogenase [ubiquinone] 1 beta subcomplex subunit 1 [Pteropus giganteus]ELK01143.1 NADH dehydrogenase [ubiquinone] 1 beta subcomplex subunit 1 [Pteropus alecto]
MAGPETQASAGAGGWARRCPWSWVVVGTETAAFTMNLIQIVRDHWVHVLVPMGFVIGCYLDGKNDEKLTAFRNKSLLFKRELRPHEEVTWK